MEEKPLLFLHTREIDFNRLYKLKDLGSVLNMSDEKMEIEKIFNYLNYKYIFLNYLDESKRQNLKYLNTDLVDIVLVLRPHESINDEFVKRIANVKYIVKSYEFLDNVKSHEEIVNSLKYLNKLKEPDGNIIFVCKKIKSFLSSCF